MTDAIIQYFRKALPDELAVSLTVSVQQFEEAAFDKVFNQPFARELVGRQRCQSPKDTQISDFSSWSDLVQHRLQLLLRVPNDDENGNLSISHRCHFLVILGLASLGAWIQSNITGPPLSFASAILLLPEGIAEDQQLLKSVRAKLVEKLVVDGNSPYKLISHVELFSLAKVIASAELITQYVPVAIWFRQRVNFIHQRILSENASSLQTAILTDIDLVADNLGSYPNGSIDSDVKASFWLEKATVELLHGLDRQAKQSLANAVKERKFQFALTGMLGKRTKFQTKDTSQLVVLARSDETSKNEQVKPEIGSAAPAVIDLNDDTLLETTSFAPADAQAEIKDINDIPHVLKQGDSAQREPLDPLDSAILLQTAASITNTSPADGLTREETMPYAVRVIDAGSSNWQVYTQALLVRSRIEGYKSRTVERGLLQLQALVDQVIAETDGSDLNSPDTVNQTTFLPKATSTESASVQERLRYVFQLGCATRWELEVELAARWVSLGGLKTALEIYTRLEMWPEVALCWAGTERNDKARQLVRRWLFCSTTSQHDTEDEDAESWEGPPRDPPPLDAPRLYCILGDLDRNPDMYEKAWELSGSRYFRAQNSLGKYWYGNKDYTKAAVAFTKAIHVKQLDHATWFALGCAYLEIKNYQRAAETFSRVVQLEPEDAESWSNLAVALLKLDPRISLTTVSPSLTLDDEEIQEHVEPNNQYKHNMEALQALKQAAKFKRESFRIWDNILTVAASTVPPSWLDMVTAQRQIINLRGKTDGERCIDVRILRCVIDHVTSFSQNTSLVSRDNTPGLVRMVCELIDRNVIPLITSDASLWLLVAQLASWRNRPSMALEAHEKAWRVTMVQPGWELGTEDQWNAVVSATLDLVKAYRGYGPQEKTEGMAAGSGELVMKDWKYKTRTALRSILGKGKPRWEDNSGWLRLKIVAENL